MADKLMRIMLAALLALPAAFCAMHAQAQAGAKPGIYADEDRDWGVPPATQLRTVGYHDHERVLAAYMGRTFSERARQHEALFLKAGQSRVVPPATQLRTVGYHGPTPTRIPGGKVVTTGELKAMLDQSQRPYLIDVLGGGVHRTIAGAFWMLGSGDGEMSKDEEARFAKAIGAFAGGDKNRAMVFYCVDSECWLSYNAALRAIALGYTNVMWYRGGIASWRTSEGAMTQSDPFFW